MAIREDEDLFLVLNLLAEPDSQYTSQLITEGYLDENLANTLKATMFITEFISSKTNLVFEGVEKQGSYFKDKGYILVHAGLKNTLTAEVILDELVKQGKMKKKPEFGYIVRCGHNH